MDVVFQVIEVVAPVFLLAAIGYGWVRIGLEYRVEFVTRLAMSLSIPCLIFMALVRTEIDPVALRDTALATVASYTLVAVIALSIVRLTGLDMRTYLAPLTFGNTGNLGLPVALFAFGSTGLDFAVVVFAIMAFLSFTVGIWVVSGSGSILPALKEPMVGATVAGAVCMLLGIQPPVWAANTLDLVGQIGIPVMLITLGVAISRLRPASIGWAVWLSVIKLAICLSVPLGVGLWFDLPDIALGVLVLQVSTPVAVTSYMLAEKYKADASEVAGLVVVSTLLSVIYIPLTLAFFI